MAESEHTLRIKAVLDTSSVPNQGGGNQPQPVVGSTQNASGTIIAAGMLGMQNALTKLTVEFSKLNLLTSAMNAFGRTSVALLTGVRAVTQQIKMLQVQLKSLGAEDVSRRSTQGGVLRGFLRKSGEARAAWSNAEILADEEMKRLRMELEKLRQKTAEATGSITKETAARNQNTNSLKANTVEENRNTRAKNRNNVAGNSSDRGIFGERGIKWTLGGSVLGAYSSSLQRILNINGNESAFSPGSLFGYAGNVAGMAAMGFGVGGPVGAVVGATAGGAQVAAEAAEKYVNDVSEELEKSVVEARQRLETLRRESSERKAAIRSYEEALQHRAVAEANSVESLQKMGASTYAVIEKLTDDIENLGRSFSLGQVPLAKYKREMEEMQRSLTLNSQLYTEITRKLDVLNQQDLDDMRRKTRGFDVLSDIIFQDQLTRQEAAVDTRSRYGTWDDVLEGLEQFAQQNFLERRTSASLYQKMMEANFAGNYEDFEMYRNEFGESRKRLSAGLAARSQLTGALQEIFKEFMTYKGLQIGDFGGLARLGGFGSTSVIQDPLLDINRDNNRLLSDILRTIREIDTEAKYIE